MLGTLISTGLSVAGKLAQEKAAPTMGEKAMNMAQQIGGNAAGVIGSQALNAVGSSVGQKVTDSMVGSPGEQVRKNLNQAYPGTSVYDRLGASGSSMGPASAARIQSQTQKQVAQINAQSNMYAADRQLQGLLMTRLPLGEMYNKGTGELMKIIDMLMGNEPIPDEIKVDPPPERTRGNIPESKRKEIEKKNAARRKKNPINFNGNPYMAPIMGPMYMKGLHP